MVSPWLRHAWRVPFCTTVSPAAQVDLDAVVELQPHLAVEHDLEVDRRGRVHAGGVGLHVPGEPRQVGLELGERGCEVRRRLATR